MLTQEDIEFIRATRREVVAGRERLITVTYEGKPDRDPFTNEPIQGTGGGTRNVNAVVTEVSSLSKAERILVGGIEAVVGDQSTILEPETKAKSYYQQLKASGRLRK